ncbi:MAG TPA: HNH endonuclease [Alphaproteobacteria bacterium]|nr:HNH endonuclease [Alphaproteobacteria bacterium]
MPRKAIDPMEAASGQLRVGLGDWWKDERRRWCSYCGIAMKLRCAKRKPIPLHKATRDHVIPKKHNGGSITIPACRSCNEAKGALSLQEFLLSDYFTDKRKTKHRHKWSIEHLWMVTALAALTQARIG